MRGDSTLRSRTVYIPAYNAGEMNIQNAGYDPAKKQDDIRRDWQIVPV